jgi:hypothetical protein
MNRRVAGGLGIGLLTALALVGCGSNSMSSGSADSGLAGPMQGANKEAIAPAAPDAKRETAGEAKSAADSVAQNRQMIRTAEVDLEGKDVTSLLVKVKDLATREGGFVGQENSTMSSGALTLRVPSDRLDAVVKGLGSLDGATVVRTASHTEDVTEQVVDVESRLATQRASVDRVRGLLERATSTSEITTIESELTKRQSDLESLQRRFDSLKGQVSLSTITISVRQVGTTPAVVAEEVGFTSALGAGWDALLVALRWVLVVLGAVLPFVVVLGVPAAVVLYLRRKRKIAQAASTN